MSRVILVYSEFNTQYARLVQQSAIVFVNKKAAQDFMRQMYDSINEDLQFLTHGIFGNTSAELNSARTHETFYWRILPAL